jgi:hypothetical protein
MLVLLVGIAEGLPTGKDWLPRPVEVPRLPDGSQVPVSGHLDPGDQQVVPIGGKLLRRFVHVGGTIAMVPLAGGSLRLQRRGGVGLPERNPPPDWPSQTAVRILALRCPRRNKLINWGARLRNEGRDDFTEYALRYAQGRAT